MYEERKASKSHKSCKAMYLSFDLKDIQTMHTNRILQWPYFHIFARAHSQVASSRTVSLLGLWIRVRVSDAYDTSIVGDCMFVL